MPGHEARLYQAINEANGTVMLNDQPRREMAHGGRLVGVECLDREERAVLLRGDARGASRLLAEGEKLPDEMTEFRKHLVIGTR